MEVENGKSMAARAGGAKSPTTAQVKMSLYRRMVLIREFEEKIAEIYPKEEIRCPVHLSIGQEATAAGMCEALGQNDQVFSSHRAHGHFLAKGGSVKGFMCELFGKDQGCCRGVGGSMHLIDLDAGFVAATPIVGGIIPVAVGAAFANQRLKNGLVSTLFLGDGTTEEGVFHESILFAALKKLPVVFFCENNGYSVYTDLKARQPDRRIADLARAHGVESRFIDGYDVLEVYQTARQAVDWCRAGKGPFFIEAQTYRWREHCGPNYDNHIGYRTEAEFLKWREKDSIKLHADSLQRDGIATTKELDQVVADVRREVLEAIEFARNAPFPPAEQMGKWVYPDCQE